MTRKLLVHDLKGSKTYKCISETRPPCWPQTHRCPWISAWRCVLPMRAPGMTCALTTTSRLPHHWRQTMRPELPN